MSNWYQKITSVFKRKELGDFAQGGLSVLSKLVSPELTQQTLIQKYKTSLYVFACINKIAMKVASIDLEMFKILNSTGDLKNVDSHPALDLLYKVNPFQTKSEFWEITIINLKTTGNAFWYKVRNTRGQVVELWNIRPDKMTIVPDPTNFIKEYRLTKNDGTYITFAPEDIIHHKYPDPLSQYLGFSPLAAAQRRVQTEEYATKWQADFFLNSARPDGLIKNSQKVLTKDQKDDIRESWHKRHGGLNNSYKVAILEGGLEYQLISLSQREMDYIESLKFTRDDILVAFQVPKPIVAIVDDVNRANSETAMHIFLSETIKPEVNRLVEKINEQLIIPDFGEDLYMEAEDPTPTNRDLELKEYAEGITNRYLLINEVRAKEGLQPIRGGWSFYGTLAEIPLGGLASADQQKALTEFKKDEKENEKRFKEAQQKKVKRFDWRGKFWLKQKFLLYEEMEKSLKGRLKRKRKGEEKKFSSLLKEPEVKQAYAQLVNKGIDGKSEHLKPALNDFYEKQKSRVLKNLEKKKPKGLKSAISAEAILKADKETALAVDFIIPYIEQYLKDSAQETLNLIAPQEDFQDSKAIQKRIQKRAEMFAETTTKTTLEKLDATLAEGISQSEGIKDLMKRVEDVYEDFPAYRTELIARTEATAANNEGAMEGFRQSGVATGKEWINSGDDRVREEHQDGVGVGGEIVDLDSDFSNGLPYPQEPNCRCVIGPAFLE